MNTRVEVNDRNLGQVEEHREFAVPATTIHAERGSLYFLLHAGEGTIVVDGEPHDFSIGTGMAGGRMVIQFSKPYPRGIATIEAPTMRALIYGAFGLDDGDPVPIGQPEPAEYENLWDFFAAEGDEGWEQRAEDDS